MTFLSDDAWLELLDVRATDPTAISAALAARTSRPLLANDGATFIYRPSGARDGRRVGPALHHGRPS
jgi:hypothetical protein